MKLYSRFITKNSKVIWNSFFISTVYNKIYLYIIELPTHKHIHKAFVAISRHSSNALLRQQEKLCRRRLYCGKVQEAIYANVAD